MNRKILVVFSLNFIQTILGAELHEQEVYLEESHHVLLGLGTPIFIARLNLKSPNENQTEIVYDRAYYPKDGEKLKYYKKTEFDKKPPGYFNYSSNGEADNRNMTENGTTMGRRGKSLEASNIVYPEIFVIVDYKTYEAHQRDIVSLAAYMAAFWNGVDLRFRQLKDPEVRLNIAGLVIATDPRVEPYLKQNSATSVRLTLDNISKHFYKRFSGFYDILVSILHSSSDITEEKVGFSFLGGVCRNHYSSVLIQDAGGFEGIIEAAHKLGRLFGAPHDRMSSIVSNGVSCSQTDGFMMSELWGTENKMHWSKCSLRGMITCLSKAECLKNKPDVIIPYSKKLPGKLLSRDEQCDRMFSGFKSIDEDRCDHLNCGYSCFNRILCSEESNYNTPPAEGSSCGTGMFCLDGKCVDDPGIYD